MYVTEKYRQGLFTTICSPHQPTWDWCSLLWLLYVLPTIQGHTDDPCLNQLKAATVKHALDERFAKYLKTDNSEFDPLPAVACLLSPDIAKVVYCSTDDSLCWVQLRNTQANSEFSPQYSRQRTWNCWFRSTWSFSSEEIQISISGNFRTSTTITELCQQCGRKWRSVACIAEVWLHDVRTSVSVRKTVTVLSNWKIISNLNHIVIGCIRSKAHEKFLSRGSVGISRDS